MSELAGNENGRAEGSARPEELESRPARLGMPL